MTIMEIIQLAKQGKKAEANAELAKLVAAAKQAATPPAP